MFGQRARICRIERFANALGHFLYVHLLSITPGDLEGVAAR
jgi:hypothetical protein